MAINGNKLIDLTQNWDEGREVTGEESMFTSGSGTSTHEQGPGKPQPNDDSGGSDGNNTTATSRGGNVPPAPTWGQIKVSPATMEAAESTILSATKGQITDFESFRDRILKDQDWVYWAESEYTSTHVTGNGKASWIAPSPKDPNPKDTAKAVDSENRLLQACGATIQLVGTFVGQLNDSAQLYASADKSSFPPDFG
jgi:hypothetical protein